MLDKVKKLFQTGFFHIFGGNVINKILSFLSSVILVRILSKMEYGIFTYAWNIYSFILIFNGLGMCNGALQLGSEKWDKSDCEPVFKYAFRTGLIFDFFVSIVMILIARFYPVTVSESRNLLYMLCVLPCMQFVYDINMIYLRVKRLNQKFAFISIMNMALLLIFSVMGAYIFRGAGLIIGKYLGYFVTMLICLLFFSSYRFLRNNLELANSEKAAIRKISGISMLNNGISQLLYLFDIFVLGVVVADESVLADYKVATMIPTALLFIPSALVTYLFPYFASHINDKKWCFDKYKKVFAYNSLINFIISFVLYIMGPLVIKTLFGDQYVDVIMIFRVLVISYFFSSSFRILSSNLLVAQRKLKFNLFEAIISGVINIFLDFYLIKLYGGIGAAIATCTVVLVSSFISTSYLIFLYKGELKG